MVLFAPEQTVSLGVTVPPTEGGSVERVKVTTFDSTDPVQSALQVTLANRLYAVVTVRVPVTV